MPSNRASRDRRKRPLIYLRHLMVEKVEVNAVWFTTI
jgi:hypothetical protein